MDITALLLSRLQFAFTISFHIIFPSFTIGLAAWLTVLEALHLATGRPAYRLVFEFWLKIFGVAFGFGVVSGIVMAFQFGTNWSVLSRMSGPDPGTACSPTRPSPPFSLEASFFGVLLFGRPRVPPWFYLFSTAMVALGTTLSAFWIMVNNSWMQVPIGYVDARTASSFRTTGPRSSSIRWSGSRFPHMLLAAYITGAFCVAATGAWYLLRRMFAAEAHIMLRMGLVSGRRAACRSSSSSAISTANTSHAISPSKMAAIEARWHDEKPASEVLIAMAGRGDRAQPLRDHSDPRPRQPDRLRQPRRRGGRARRAFPPKDWPPVLIPFFAFRIMVGCWPAHAGAGLGRIVSEPQRTSRAAIGCCFGRRSSAFRCPSSRR